MRMVKDNIDLGPLPCVKSQTQLRDAWIYRKIMNLQHHYCAKLCIGKVRIIKEHTSWSIALHYSQTQLRDP